MPKTTPPAAVTTGEEYRLRFAGRIAELRMRRGYTQQNMADALAIPLARYKKYEIRTPLPHQIVHQFCVIVGANINDLFDLDRPLPGGKSVA